MRIQKLQSVLFAALFSFMAITLVGQTHDLDFFNGVDVGGDYQVTLVKADRSGYDIKMIKGDEKDIVIDVNKKTLMIKNRNSWGNSNEKAKITVYYTDDIDDIEASAGSTVSSDEVLSGEGMDIEVSSGAKVRVEIDTDDVDLEVSSGGSMTVIGKAKTVDCSASSGGKIKASGLIAETVEADASSGGSIKCHASKAIEAETSSGGDIRYSGNPKSKDLDTGWSGTIKKIQS